MKRAFFVLLFALVSALFSTPSLAAAGRAAVAASSGGNIVELSLGPDGEVMSGEFFIRNTGDGPLDVSRVSLRSSPSDPRLPPGVTVEIPGVRLGTNVQIAPGQERRALVKWRTQSARARELYGQVLVESNTRAGSSDEPGRALSLGIHAERPLDRGPIGFIFPHALSLLVLLPIVSALLALVLRLLRRDTPRLLALTSGVVHGLNLLLGLALAFRFDRLFSRADGNDGFQFIERGVLSSSLGIEYFLGVDGISLALVLGVSLAALIASIASSSLERRPASFHISAGLFVSTTLGVLVSLDLALFCVFWLVGLVPACLLVARSPRPNARNAALRMFVSSLLGAALLLAACHFLVASADPTYLATGELSIRNSSIPELSRVAWISKGLTLFGANGVKVIWSALFAAFMLRLSAAPFPGFSAHAHAEAEAPTSVLFSAALFATGVYGLLRLVVFVLPDGARWASTGVSVLGVVLVFAGAFGALAESDMKRFFARISGAHVGLALLGIGSRTPQGIEASVTIAALSGLVLGSLFLLTEVLESRARVRDLGRFGGLASKMPVFAAVYGIAMLASLGLPSLAGFWGPMLALFGAFARDRLLAVFAAVSFVTLAGVHLFALSHVLFGDVRDEWKFKLSEMTRRELAFVLGPVLVIVLLGLFPKPLLGLLDRSCLEIHRLVDRPGPSQIS